MLNKLLPFETDTWAFVLSSLLLAVGGAVLLYIVMFYVLRSIFRQFERDIALVTLNVSAYPALTVFILAVLKLAFHQLPSVVVIDGFENILAASLIIAVSYWLVQLFIQVFIYYLKEYTQQTEAMWDDVLLPLLEAVVPVVIVLIASVFVLRSLGVDLTGIWVALGGATFVIGFAAQGILANFFSGVVLLIDTPFQFGDVLRLEDGSIAMLRKIGVRVTQLYLPDQHCDIYIPNSKLQEQNIVNLSRPTAYYHYSTEVSIPSGDGVVLYTDGIPEARDIHGKFYEMERLCAAVSQNWHKDAEQVKQSVIEDVRRFIGKQKVFDDITLVVFKRKDDSAVSAVMQSPSASSEELLVLD